MADTSSIEDALADLGIEACGPRSTWWQPEGCNKHGGGLIETSSSSREGAMGRLPRLKERWPDLEWSVVRVETWELRHVLEPGT